jgi:hypothetical protein
LPGPVVSLQANPSAFSLVTSLLSYDSHSRIRLLAGHSAVVAVEEYRPNCRPLSRLRRVMHFSTVLLLPPIKTPLSPASSTMIPFTYQ